MHVLVLLLAATTGQGEATMLLPAFDTSFPRQLPTEASGQEIPTAKRDRHRIDRDAALGKQPAESLALPPRSVVQQASYEEDAPPIRQAQYSDPSTWPSGNSATGRNPEANGGGDRTLLDELEGNDASSAYIPPNTVPSLPPLDGHEPTYDLDPPTVQPPRVRRPTPTDEAGNLQGGSPPPRTYAPTSTSPRAKYGAAVDSVGANSPPAISTPPKRNYANARKNIPNGAARPTDLHYVSIPQTGAPAPRTNATINVPNPAHAVENAVNGAASAVSQAGNAVEGIGANVKDGLSRGVSDVRNEIDATKRRGVLSLNTMALFLSLGLNCYLGWIAWDTYNRYQDMVSDLRSPRRDRYDRDRDLGRPIGAAFDDRRAPESSTY